MILARIVPHASTEVVPDLENEIRAKLVKPYLSMTDIFDINAC